MPTLLTKERNEDGKTCFSSEQHRAFYERCMARVRDDSCHKALLYLLGVSADTRKMVGHLFDKVKA